MHSFFASSFNSFSSLPASWLRDIGAHWPGFNIFSFCPLGPLIDFPLPACSRIYNELLHRHLATSSAYRAATCKLHWCLLTTTTTT
jgi:hypothetical protein